MSGYHSAIRHGAEGESVTNRRQLNTLASLPCLPFFPWSNRLRSCPAAGRGQTPARRGGSTRGRASFRSLRTSREAAKPQKGTQKSFRRAKGDDGGTPLTAPTLGHSAPATRSLIVAFRSGERTETKSPFRRAKDDERMPGGWGTWPRTPIGGDRARSG
jgi:hypothetical protein